MPHLQRQDRGIRMWVGTRFLNVYPNVISIFFLNHVNVLPIPIYDLSKIIQKIKNLKHYYPLGDRGGEFGCIW